MFVEAMRQSGSFCAYTGDSISDAMAISKANVGISMGKSGCAVTKDQADIIILDDNFSSVKNASKWGRNIYDNARKFIQYQLTANIVVMVFVIVGGATLGRSPFNVI